MSTYPTPHINATPADFAATVLMPGDPLRSKFIAETYLTAPKLVNNVRGVQGYTGTFRGVPVSVMASGMGMPSMGIYSYELYQFFGVENIIRVGSAGAMSPEIHVRDIVAGMSSCTDSNFAAQYDLPGLIAPTASFKMLKACSDLAEKKQLPFHVGSLLSSDVFYRLEPESTPADQTHLAKWARMGILAVEMESAALYLTAARCKKNALAICTISDHLITGENTTADERQNTFTQMMELALETAIKL